MRDMLSCDLTLHTHTFSTLRWFIHSNVEIARRVAAIFFTLRKHIFFFFFFRFIFFSTSRKAEILLCMKCSALFWFSKRLFFRKCAQGCCRLHHQRKTRNVKRKWIQSTTIFNLNELTRQIGSVFGFIFIDGNLIWIHYAQCKLLCIFPFSVFVFIKYFYSFFYLFLFIFFVSIKFWHV